MIRLQQGGGVGISDSKRFAKIGFEDFQRMAAEPGLSAAERIGFPDCMRSGRDLDILADIRRKLPALDRREQTIVDIGCGCGDLVMALAGHCHEHRHRLALIDGAGVIERLPDAAGTDRWAAHFPDCPEVRERYRGKADAVIVYSVIQYVFVEGNLWSFLDACLELLAPGGALLLGDVPNVSKRKRFLASEAGRVFHRQYAGDDSEPDLRHGQLEPGHIDDSVVFGLLARGRSAGFDAYVLPQDPALPMANRREDLVFCRP